MLGDFDIDATLTKPLSIAMFVIFQVLVVVLMMNLIVAIMAGTSRKYCAAQSNMHITLGLIERCLVGARDRLVRESQRKRDRRGPARAREDDRKHGAAL